jgi:Zinc carboxypeptidase
VAFIGNIHGGWEPAARVVIDVGLEYFLDNPALVPPELTLYFIPTINPDGYEAGRPLWEDADGTGGPGDVALARTAFNANDVDLNRNFPTNWSADACGGERVRLTWGDTCQEGLGGPHPFSEPETRAYRDFILRRNVGWALTYHEDQSPAIVTREGGGGASEPFAEELADLFGYPYLPTTPAYVVTGQAWDWLDRNGVLGAEIELEYRSLDVGLNLSAMQLLIEWALDRS